MHRVKSYCYMHVCVNPYLFSLLALMVFPRLWFVCYAQHSNHALSCDLYEAPNCKLSMELNE